MRPPPRRAATIAARALQVLAWAILAALVVATLARLLFWDRWEPVIVFDAVIDVAYVPAWVILVTALVVNRRRMALVAAALVVTQVTLLWPELTAATATPAVVPPGATVRLFDANVQYQNTDMAAYAREITSWRADVVTLEEAVPSDVDRLRAAGAFGGLDHVQQLGPASPFSFIVASRFPMGPLQFLVAPAGYGLLAVHTELQIPGHPVALWVVHTTAPVSGEAAAWRGDLARLAAVLARQAGPVVVAGDFNATWGNRGFRSILDEGFGDAAAMRGNPWQMTWSQLVGPMPPFVRIDHVLVRGGPQPVSTAVGDGPGSDHRDLRVVLAL